MRIDRRTQRSVTHLPHAGSWQNENAMLFL